MFVCALQSPNTGPELFAEVLGTLAAACDALSSSGSGSSNGSSGFDDDGSGAAGGGRDVDERNVLSQLVAVDDLLGLLRACLAPGESHRLAALTGAASVNIIPASNCKITPLPLSLPPPGALEDDALLEGVVLLGALAGRADCEEALADSGLVS